MHAARKGTVDFDAVVVWKLDRFGRNRPSLFQTEHNSGSPEVVAELFLVELSGKPENNSGTQGVICQR
jgi:hypothetical protein